VAIPNGPATGRRRAGSDATMRQKFNRRLEPWSPGEASSLETGSPGTWRSPTTSPSTSIGATPFSATSTARSCRA